MGLSDSKVRVSKVTPCALQKAMINAGKLSQEVLDWVICVICLDIMLPRSMSIYVTNP